MTITSTPARDQQDLLAGWVQRARRPTRRHEPNNHAAELGLRFAFYGRASTRNHQHRSTSLAWQRDAAESLIGGRGVIVAEYFDTGCSRRLPWARRPQAAALLSTLTNSDREFDAVVIGEYERAFTDHQFTEVFALFERHGVQLWLPEAGGRFERDNPTHQALMTMLGAQSHREVLRTRHRVLAAMCSQTRDQGRYLGGRPPYGYRLTDAGPHPNQAHAQWGRRMQQLEPDPATAPQVRWIFTQRLAGVSVAGIARQLNDRGTPCPSSLDPDRNPHRSGQAWTLHTVATILANPRYTGHQVWNRHTARHAHKGNGPSPVRGWSEPQQWVISTAITHPPLVSEANFIAVQTIRATRPTSDGTSRTYLLTGLLRCGFCGRRMDSHWIHHRPGYRCRHGHTSTQPRSPHQPKNLYLREDQILTQLTSHFNNPDPGNTTAPRTHNPDATEITQYLRENNLVLIYDTEGTLVNITPT